MEYIKSWLKTILYMNVLLLICDNLMQKTAYEKYYRFFSGFLLVVCLLKPVIDFAGTEQYFQVSFLQEEWKNERNLLGNVKEFQDMQDVLKKEYETAYKNQIEEIAKKKNIQVKKITFWWDNKRTFKTDRDKGNLAKRERQHASYNRQSLTCRKFKKDFNAAL